MTRTRQRYADTPQISSSALSCLELARQSGITVGAAAETLAVDPAAEQRIIALANTDLFSGRRSSANLHQALDNLGIREALILNAACEAFSALELLPSGRIDRDTFKHRACIAATWGVTLAREFGRRDGAELLLTAMIQDVGILLIAHGAPDTYADLDPLSTDRNTLAELEFAALKSNHRQAGAWLASTWQLPDNVIRTLRFGHDLAAHDVAHRERGFYRAVNFCTNLTDVWFQPQTEPTVAQLSDDAQKHLGISPDRLVELFDTVCTRIPQLASIFGYDAGTTGHDTGIAGQVRRLLPPSNVRNLTMPAVPTTKPAATRSTPAVELLDAPTFADRLEEEFILTVQHDWPLTLILVEIDHFNDLREFCGPQTSAQIHNDIAALLSRSIRASDMISSQNENRFAILLPGSDAAMAAMVATRLVEEAHRCISKHEHAGDRPVTVSIGVATLSERTPFARATELSTAATAALKHSTDSGRNRLTTYASIQAA